MPLYGLCPTHGTYPKKKNQGCPTCTTERDKRRGTSTQRGYDHEHQRRAAAAIAAHPYCADCGHRGSPRNPLTAGHIIPIALGGDPRGPLKVQCLSCNSSEGATIRR